MLEWVRKEKRAEPHLEFSPKEKHFLVFVTPKNPSERLSFDGDVVASKIGMGYGKVDAENRSFLHKLWKHGYVVISIPNQATLTDKGIEIAERFKKEIEALQEEQSEKLTSRFKNHEVEGDKFLIWAWKQNRGDLKHAVDARAYAKQRGLNRYEIIALLEWLEAHELVRIKETEYTWVNFHAKQYWTVPLNTSMPHGYFVFLSPEGSAKGARLVTHKRAWPKRAAVVAWNFFSDGKNLALLTLVLSIVSGWIGYHKGFDNGQRSTVSTQPIPAATPPTNKSTAPTTH